MGSTQQDVPWDRALPADRNAAICHIAKTSQPLERLICGGEIEGKTEIDLDCAADGNGNTFRVAGLNFQVFTVSIADLSSPSPSYREPSRTSVTSSFSSMTIHRFTDP